MSYAEAAVLAQDAPQGFEATHTAERAVLEAARTYAEAYETLIAGVPYSVTRHNEAQGALCRAAVVLGRAAVETEETRP